MPARNIILLVLSFIVCRFSSAAQHDSLLRRNAISAEVFGSSVGFALHYERQVTRNAQFNLILCQGIGRMRFGNNISSAHTWLFPASVLVANQRGPHRTELGFATTLCYGHRTVQIWPSDGTGIILLSEFRTNLLLFAHIGYRYDWPGKHIFARAAFTPLLARIYPGREELNQNNITFYPWAGGGIGWKF